MKAKTVPSAAAVILLCALSFYLGKRTASQSVLVYPVKANRVAVHLDWPTYGLPLAEYEATLSVLRNGNTNRAIEFLEIFLDQAIYDAKRRRVVLPNESQRSLDKAIEKAARYRERFPRPLDQETNGPLLEMQKDVDQFLEQFSKRGQVK